MTFPFQRANALGYALYENFPSADATLIDLNAASAADGAIWSDLAAVRNLCPETQVHATAQGRTIVWESSSRKWIMFGINSAQLILFQSYDGFAFELMTLSSPGFSVEPSSWPAAAVNGSGIVVGAGTVAAADRLIRSADAGETWAKQSTVRAAAATPAFMVWAQTIGLFVLGFTAADNTNIETSPDGITWTQRTLPNANGRAYGATNGSIIVVTAASATDKVITSTDGITWTERTMPASKIWSVVCWSNQQQKFMALSGDGLAGAISDDGITWTALPVGHHMSSAPGYDLLSIGRVWIVTGDAANVSLGSVNSYTGTKYSIDDGASWHNGAIVDQVSAAAVSNSQLVIVDQTHVRSSIIGGV